MRLTIDKPNEKQDMFLRATERHVAYGGARGGGKSWGVRTKAKLLALRYPGIKICIVRKTYAELINNHVTFLQAELNGIARYNKTEKTFYFPNSSTIAFRYCAADGDLDQYQGAEYDVIFLDEAGQLKEEWIKKINACVRGVNGFPKRTYYTLNPGGPSHGYFRRLFVDRRFEKNEKPEDYRFIQAKVTDNKALMESQPEYVAELEALPPHLRAMWLEGVWDIYIGQFFEEFVNDPDHYKDRRFTHVIEPFDIPSGWTIYRSYDFGYAKPFSCAWWAIDYDGIAYRILELYGCTQTPNEGVKWTPDKQFAKIREIEETHPWLRGRNIRGVADPAIWDASRGESISETAAKHRVYFDKGDNRRLAGWMQMHYRMQFDENGFPMMYIFRNCEGFIRTIPLLMYDQHQPEDLDTSMEDHIADETRYFCMTRPISPRRPVEQKTLLNDPLNQRADIGKYYDYRRI